MASSDPYAASALSFAASEEQFEAMRTAIDKLGEMDDLAASDEGMAAIRLGETLSWQQGLIIAIGLLVCLVLFDGGLNLRLAGPTLQRSVLQLVLVRSLLGLARDSNLYQLGMMLTFLVIILVTLRALFQPLILRYGGPAGDDTHGSARFATDRETRPLAQNGDGLLIGRDRKSGKPLRYAGPAHLLTIAPTRTGKGVGTIIPNLLDYPGPVVCIDPKGENARITAHYRARFGPVHVLDPFGVTRMVGAAFNPLDRIDPAGLDLADDCMTLADALVYDAPGEAGEAHWNEEAKALIAGLILHIVTSEPAGTRTLATLRDRLTLAPQAFAAQLEAMQAQGGLAAGGHEHLAIGRQRAVQHLDLDGLVVHHQQAGLAGQTDQKVTCLRVHVGWGLCSGGGVRLGGRHTRPPLCMAASGARHRSVGTTSARARACGPGVWARRVNPVATGGSAARCARPSTGRAGHPAPPRRRARARSRRRRRTPRRCRRP